MDSKLSAKVVSLFLVLSFCMLGYVSTNAWATVTPTDGQIGIDKTIQINQSDNVRIFFTGFTGAADWYGDSLVVDHEYTQVNDGTQIGVASTVECNLNLTTWATIPVNNAGTVAEFSLWSATGWTAFTFYIGNLHSGAWYNVFIDGVLGPERLVGTPITWAFAGSAGTHTFEVRQSAMSPENLSLIGLLFFFLFLGVMVAPIQLIRKAMNPKKRQTLGVQDVIRVAMIVIIGVTLIVAAMTLVG